MIPLLLQKGHPTPGSAESENVRSEGVFHMSKSTVSAQSSVGVSNLTATVAGLDAAVAECASRPSDSVACLKAGASAAVTTAPDERTFRALLASMPTGTDSERQRRSLVQSMTNQYQGFYAPVGDLLAGLRALQGHAMTLWLKANANNIATAELELVKMVERYRGIDRKARATGVTLEDVSLPTAIEMVARPECVTATHAALDAAEKIVSPVFTRLLDDAKAPRTQAPKVVGIVKMSVIKESAPENVLALRARYNAAVATNVRIRRGISCLISIDADLSNEGLAEIEKLVAEFERDTAKAAYAFDQSAAYHATEAKRQALAAATQDVSIRFMRMNIMTRPSQRLILPEGVELVSEDTLPRTSAFVTVKCESKGVTSLRLELRPTAFSASVVTTPVVAKTETVASAPQAKAAPAKPVHPMVAEALKAHAARNASPKAPTAAELALKAKLDAEKSVRELILSANTNLAFSTQPVTLPKGVELAVEEVLPRKSRQILVRASAHGIKSLTVYLPESALTPPPPTEDELAAKAESDAKAKAKAKADAEILRAKKSAQVQAEKNGGKNKKEKGAKPSKSDRKAAQHAPA